MRRVLALCLGLSFSFGCDHSVRPVAAEGAPTSPPSAVAAPAPGAETTPPPAGPARSPSLLAAMLREYDAHIAAGGDPAVAARLREAIDHVAGQHDAYMSRLYWYTDLGEAEAEAKRTGKPILSLRLLGRLDDELSCANSRLFRLALYANEHLSGFLRDTYVLHWSSERPAPRMTIDLGDGRVVTRTITGNSAHYVLDARGRVVDVLPGLYGPAQFERQLHESLDLARRAGDMSDDELGGAVSKYHGRERWLLTLAWRKELKRAFEGYDEYTKDAQLPARLAVPWPHPLYASLPATVVNDLTVSKADMEAPQIGLFQPEIQVSAPWSDWEKLTSSIPVDHLDAQSRALIRAKHPRDWSSAEAPELDEAKLAKTIARFERRMTDDGIRNEYVYHGEIHARLAKHAPRLDFESVNDFVYASVFLTARGDAWLGLMPTDALTGIAGDGLLPRAD